MIVDSLISSTIWPNVFVSCKVFNIVVSKVIKDRFSGNDKCGSKMVLRRRCFGTIEKRMPVPGYSKPITPIRVSGLIRNILFYFFTFLMCRSVFVICLFAVAKFQFQ